MLPMPYQQATMLKFRVYRRGREVVLAACDEELVGRELRDGKLRLRVEEAFYGTESISPGELVPQLRACTIANLVGEQAVGVALEHGFVAREHVLWIAGVPHAQMATL
jgi:uncharacterized protein